MSNYLAIYFYLKSEFQKDSEKWFKTREVASIFKLSINRTRVHLSSLWRNGDAERKTIGWCDAYKFKR